MSDYQAARKRVEADLAFSEEKRFIYASPKTRDLRALLAGPPEPSVEEVAPIIHRLVLDCSEDEARLAAQAVQTLYRSKTND